MTAGDWQPRTKADVESTLADLVETSSLFWRAQAPDSEAVFGRWIRGHSHSHPGWEFNHQAAIGAKWGCLGVSTGRRMYTFQFVENQLAWLATESTY